MREKIVIFDFDGVIIDSFRASFSIMQGKNPTLTEEEYRTWFEGNINKVMRSTHAPMPQPVFFEEYNRKAASLLPIPEIVEEIPTLAKIYPLAIVSSTTTKIIASFLKQHEILNYFEVILGNDISPSKVVKFNMLFEQYKIGDNDAVYITDTLGDIREAQQVNMPTIAVTWGFHDEALLRSGNPTNIIHKPAELSEKVSAVLK